jgi:uncharacterized membrane protein
MENEFENNVNVEEESLTEEVMIPPAELPPEFISDFTVSEIRSRAVKAQKGRLLNAFPKALLFSMLLTIPTLLIFMIAVFKSGSNTAAGNALKVISIIIPLIFGGPLLMGFIAGCLEIDRGQKFKVSTLFFAFKDNWFLKAVGSFLLFCLAAAVSSAVCSIPAVIVKTLSANLSEGFAYVATNVIMILLLIAGIVVAAQFYLRLLLMFPLLIDNPDMKVTEAAKTSIRAMKRNTWKLFMLFLSYIGWAVLSFGIAAAIIWGIAYAGYFYIVSIANSGDFYTAYYWLIIGITIIYPLAYIAMTIAYSTFIARPYIALAAFYDVMTGYEPPEELVGDTEASDETDETEDNLSEPELPIPEETDETVLPVPEEVDETADTEAESNDIVQEDDEI